MTVCMYRDIHTLQPYIIYFWNKTLHVSDSSSVHNQTLHVSDSSSVHHQEFFTVHTAMVYVIQLTVTACEQDLDGTSSVLILLASCQQTCMTNTIAVYTVKNSWWWTEELFETCRILFQKWIWQIGASSWFYYKNISRCTVTWTSDSEILDASFSINLAFFSLFRFNRTQITLLKKYLNEL